MKIEKHRRESIIARISGLLGMEPRIDGDVKNEPRVDGKVTVK